MSWKIAPALAAGNTAVMKPAQVTPLTAIHLTRLLEEAGTPAGVVNLVLGPGERVGQALADTPDVDLVSLTGGLDAGSRAAARRGRQRQARRPRARRQEPEHRVRRRRLRDRRRQRADRGVHPLRPGLLGRLPGDRPGRDLRPVRRGDRPARRTGSGSGTASTTRPRRARSSRAAHRAKVEATSRPPSPRAPGSSPAAADPPSPSCRPASSTARRSSPTSAATCGIVREEVFGPVLTIERFTTEDEAIELGNDTTYGLAGAVWTADAGRAQRVAGRLRHGTVWINDYNTYLPQAEWGGFKQSGIGRELGPSGLDEYREAKHIWQNTAPGPTGWFGG